MKWLRKFLQALTDCTFRPNEYVECHMERFGGQGDCFTCWRMHREKGDTDE